MTGVDWLNRLVIMYVVKWATRCTVMDGTMGLVGQRTFVETCRTAGVVVCANSAAYSEDTT